jgi:hypothetical protein
MKPKKYIQGDAIKSLQDFESWTGAGGWLYWHGRPKHPAFMRNQQYAVLITLIFRNRLFRAIENPEWREENVYKAGV